MIGSLIDFTAIVTLQLREYDGEKNLECLKKLPNLKYLTIGKIKDTESMNKLIQQLPEAYELEELRFGC